MNWIESIVYGIVSGFTEFLPISSHAHQKLLMELFGVQTADPVRDFIVHLAMLLCLYSACRSMIEHLHRERRSQIHSQRNFSRVSTTFFDQRFVINAAIPMLIGLVVLYYILPRETSLLFAAGFLFVNGLILFVPGRMLQGNKDARSMSYLDSLLIGIVASFSAITGVSRVGCITSASIARGADRQNSLKWAFILSIPALFLGMGVDILQIIADAGMIRFWESFFTYILSGLGAFIGGYYSIRLMKFLTVRTGFSGFSYYCWGASLFSFLLYLTVV